MKSASSLLLPLTVNGRSLKAVVDTGAEVSIISERLFHSLPNRPPTIEFVTMRNASQDSSFKARRIGPLNIKIKDLTLTASLYVGPICDNMLIGFRLLKTLNAILDLGKNSLQIDNMTVQLETPLGGIREEPNVHRVTLSQPIRIPALSEIVTSLPERFPSNSPFMIFEPDPKAILPMARTVFRSETGPILSLINCEPRAIVLPVGTSMGTVTHAVKNDLEVNVRRVHEEPDMNPPKEAGETSSSLSPLQSLWSDVDEVVSEETREKTKQLVLDFSDIFAKSKYDLGSFSTLTHSIDTGGAPPVKLGLRRTPVHFLDEERKIIREMLSAGIIEPSTSSWAAAPVLVKKKTGEIRFALDYRKLNELTKKDVFPISNLGDCLDALEGNNFFSKLDANSAYWQVPLEEESKPKTAFRTRSGLYQFRVLAFGLCNAPATYSRVMELVLSGLQWDVVLSFLDDLCVLGKTEEEHLENLRKVFERFKEYGLKFKPQKCSLFQTSVEFLGRYISQNGVTLTDHSLSTIRDWPVPKNLVQVQSFLGLANYHREFIPNLAELAEPLYAITKKDSFMWHDSHQQAFERLKEALLSPAVLVVPNKTDPFILAVDASHTCIGAELLQVQEGKERVVAYGSFALVGPQLNYCVTRKELLSLLRFCHHFRHYLLGRTFTVRTDHYSLIWLQNFKHPQGQLLRWMEQLAEYNMVIQHRAGKEHQNADALSRRPHPNLCPSEISAGIPCRNCSYCKKSTAWEQFDATIDDVCPLADTLHINRLEGSRETAGLDVIIDVRTLSDCSANGDYPWSPAFLAEEQNKDPKLKKLISFLQTTQVPPEDELSLAGNEEKFYMAQRNSFFLEKGVLWFDNPNGEPLLVIPIQLKEHVLFTNHDLPTAGHQGLERTRDRIKARYFWFRMSKDIKNYVRVCDSCNKNKHSNRRNKYPRVIFHAGIPLEKVHLDFLGPLPKTERGNEHLLVMVDQFTKWTEAFPLPNQEAETAAMAAVHSFFARFGFPLNICTDQGTNFQSRLFAEMCNLLHIHKLRTTPYRPSANGQVERANRTLMACLRNFVADDQKDWDLYIPLLTAAIRSCKNRSTGLTPNMMMLGRETYCPGDLVFPLRGETPTSPEAYVQKLSETLQAAHESARTTLKVQLKKEKRSYDLKQNIESFKKGDAVYLLDKKPPKKGKSKKLQPVWTGPFVVMACPTPYTIVIKVKAKNTLVVSHDLLKRCHTSNLPSWILNIQESFRTGRAVVFCLCKQTEYGEMVMCDTCHDWFHLPCVGLNRKSVKTLPEFHCPNCVK